MPDLQEIYRTRPDRYDELVSLEDWTGNLLPAIRSRVRLDDAVVVEFGAGTGRVTRLLAPHVRSIAAFDASRPMVDAAARRLARDGHANCSVSLADHRAVPAATGLADIAIAGWTISAIAVAEKDWRPEVERALGEMRRVLRPGGTIVIIETLGTGWPAPHPPDSLLAYYDLLKSRAFEDTWVRTDYRFRDLEEARSLTRFFFGEGPLAALERREDGVILPECTGLWWTTRGPDA